ncbi:helix-turn-helix domain-containing protein [Alkalicoccus chagannorensis]|uniref:helix-turn-helix domain-containing protein n=1 Tax=Alkalicoccus chagannorensis TaxID=427072 RepID=UPI000688980C|nr:XRE family transcriptional regulator [Alkalicoccus chagannorensis]
MEELSEKDVESMSFGEVLYFYRKKKSLTMQQLAREVEVSQSYISNLENGKRKDPSYEVMFSLADKLDINPYTLIEKVASKETGSSKPQASLQKEINDFEAEQGYDTLKELKNILSDDYVMHLDSENESSTQYVFSVHLNGHRLNDDERKRLLKVAELMFPQYTSNENK